MENASHAVHVNVIIFEEKLSSSIILGTQSAVYNLLSNLDYSMCISPDRGVCLAAWEQMYLCEKASLYRISSFSEI